MAKRIILVVSTVLLLSACAAPPETPLLEQNPSGFWSGIWHGLILTFSFIGSLFSENIVIYDIDNNGGWYDFGFLLGAGFFFGGSGAAR